MDGILLSHLKSLALEVPAQWTVRTFKKEYVLPRTKNLMNYVDYLREDESTRHFTSTKPDVFISYAWDLKFSDVISSLPIDDENPDRFVWMDVFCFRHDKDSVPSSEEFFIKFKEALKEIGRAELVVMPWRNPLPPKRSWCIFEYSVIVQEGLDYKCRMGPSDKVNFKTFLRKNRTSSAFFKNIFAAVNVLAAKAERKGDEDRIWSIVESVGPTTVNDAVKDGLRNWLEGVLTETLKEIQGSGDEDEANVLCAWAFLCNSLGKFREALIAFESSLAIRKRLVTASDDTQSIVALKSNIALVLVELKNYQDAEVLLRDVHDWLKENATSTRQSSVTTAITCNNLANVLRKLHRLDEAEQLYNQAITYFEKFAMEQTLKSGRSIVEEEEDENSSHKDMTPVQIAVCLNNLGRLFQKKGEHHEAERLFRKALAVDESHYSPGHIEIGVDLHNLAKSLHKMGRKAEALEYGKKALDIFTRVYGKDGKLTEPVAKYWGPRLARASRRMQRQVELREQSHQHDTDEPSDAEED